jgi:hypothetical protein
VERYSGTEKEVLPGTDEPAWLWIEYVLQRYRDVWVTIPQRPFLAIDVARLADRVQRARHCVVFPNGRLMQNLRPDEAGGRLLDALGGGGAFANLAREAQVIVEGTANPQSNWMSYFNDPFYVGMHPFAALGTHYIVINGGSIYQRQVAELDPQHGLPRSELVDFAPLAQLVRAFHDDYINGTRGLDCDLTHLTNLLDAIFVENRKILTLALRHHRARAPTEQPFDYIAPTLTRYGRLTHDVRGAPRIEMVFALLHYEKALREFDALKQAVHVNDASASFLHGVYCVVATAACVEAIGNRLSFRATGKHPDHRDHRTPIQKINESAAALVHNGGPGFQPLMAGDALFDSLDSLRKLRNTFMHATEADAAVEPGDRVSAVVADVSEVRCRDYLRHLRLAVAHVYDQLPHNFSRPIATHDNRRWLSSIEIP